MAKKNTVKYNSEDVKNLKNDKSVVYDIINKNDNINYTGVAKRGRVVDRINEHLGEIPGAKVRIRQYSSISDAEKAEARKIAKEKPKYTKKGK